MPHDSAPIVDAPDWGKAWSAPAARLFAPGLVTRAGARLRRMELDQGDEHIGVRHALHRTVAVIPSFTG